MAVRDPVKVEHSGRLNLPSLMVVLWVFRRAKKGQDRDRPQIVSLNAKSKAVLDRAKQLAGEGREDGQAVAELRALAGEGRRTLRQAERASRFGGYHHELQQANLAHRLLQAAHTRTPVAAIAPEDQERIETVEAFNRLPRSEQWARLTSLQPLLIELEADVRAGRFGGLGKPPPKEEVQQLLEHGRRHNDLMERLKPLVGPDSADEDLLVSSQRAFEVARLYLMTVPATG